MFHRNPFEDVLRRGSHGALTLCIHPGFRYGASISRDCLFAQISRSRPSVVRVSFSFRPIGPEYALHLGEGIPLNFGKQASKLAEYEWLSKSSFDRTVCHYFYLPVHSRFSESDTCRVACRIRQPIPSATSRLAPANRQDILRVSSFFYATKSRHSSRVPTIAAATWPI